MESQKRPRDGIEFQKDKCLSFVSRLWKADTVGMFHHPVSATDVPGYYDAIAAPMDLSTIRTKIESNEYHSDSEVEDDVGLMISNALEFNEKDSVWFQHAKRLRSSFHRLAVESGLALDEDCAFIPSKRARDDESTLRRAEKKGGEELPDVLTELAKERTIPLEELRAKYARDRHIENDNQSVSGSDESESEESETSDSSDEESAGSESDSDSGGSSAS